MQLDPRKFHRGVELLRVDKAGKMLGSQRTSPSTLAPVESMIRTVRELIEQYRRVGEPGKPWHQQVAKLVMYYNNTVHSAFKNKDTPYEVATRPALQEDHKEENEEERKADHAEIRGQQLQAGDYVRIMRQAKGFDKQSLPTLSYDVYRVKDTYRHNNDFVYVPVVRVRQQNREAEGLYTQPAKKNVEEPPEVHHSRVVRVKTFEVDGQGGQTIDPPPGSRWFDYFAEIDTRTYTQRQTKEGDYFLKPKKRRRGNAGDAHEGDVGGAGGAGGANEEEEEAPAAPRRGGRERRAPRRLDL